MPSRRTTSDSREIRPPAYAGGSDKAVDPQSFHVWLKRVSPGMTWDWKHQTYIIEQLEKITTGECKRLMIFLPPRHGKSELVTVRYSAWRMQREPSMSVILGSYNQRLADRFSRKVRRVIADAQAEPPALAGGEDSADETPRVMSKHPSAASLPLAYAGGSAQSPPPAYASLPPAHAGGSACAARMFPFAASRPANSVSEWETAAGGGFRSVGVGGGVTGFGAQLIVIDDPVKSRAEAESRTYRENVWDWFNDDLYTRLEPNGAVILIQTRWHEDDLAGRLLREMREGGEHWDVIDFPALAERSGDTPVTERSRDTPVPTGAPAPAFRRESGNQAAGGLGDKSVPAPADWDRSSVPAPADWRSPGQALCPERFDEAALEKIRRKLGTYSFSALYQQRPAPSDGGTFRREWFRRIIPYAPPGLKWKRGYDLAVSMSTNADYTASFRCAFDNAGNLYIDGGFRKRIEFPEQRRFVIERILAEPDTEHGIELALHGQALIQDLRREPEIRGHMLRGVKVAADKFTRALAWAPLAEEGKVILVRNRDTPVPKKRSGDTPVPTGAPAPAFLRESGNQAASGLWDKSVPAPSGGWIDDFLDEAAAFPVGQHDDQIDAVSIAVQMLKKREYKAYGF